MLQALCNTGSHRPETYDSCTQQVTTKIQKVISTINYTHQRQISEGNLLTHSVQSQITGIVAGNDMEFLSLQAAHVKSRTSNATTYGQQHAIYKVRNFSSVWKLCCTLESNDCTIRQISWLGGAYASVRSSLLRPMASGFASGSSSAKRLNQADISCFWFCQLTQAHICYT